MLHLDRYSEGITHKTTISYICRFSTFNLQNFLNPCTPRALIASLDVRTTLTLYSSAFLHIFCFVFTWEPLRSLHLFSLFPLRCKFLLRFDWYLTELIIAVITSVDSRYKKVITFAILNFNLKSLILRPRLCFSMRLVARAVRLSYVRLTSEKS